MSVPIDAYVKARSSQIMMYLQRDGRFGRWVRLCGNCAPVMIQRASRPVDNMGFAERDAKCAHCGAEQSDGR